MLWVVKKLNGLGVLLFEGAFRLGMVYQALLWLRGLCFGRMCRVAMRDETSSDFEILRPPFLDSLVALVVAYRLFSRHIFTG